MFWIGALLAIVAIVIYNKTRKPAGVLDDIAKTSGIPKEILQMIGEDENKTQSISNKSILGAKGPYGLSQTTLFVVAISCEWNPPIHALNSTACLFAKKAMRFTSNRVNQGLSLDNTTTRKTQVFLRFTSPKNFITSVVMKHQTLRGSLCKILDWILHCSANQFPKVLLLLDLLVGTGPPSSLDLATRGLRRQLHQLQNGYHKARVSSHIIVG